MACNPEAKAELLSLLVPSQSPYGAKWLATSCGGPVKQYLGKSQSPYGAKWFATPCDGCLSGGFYLSSQSPYGAMWFATGGGGRMTRHDHMSQSPYGAMWFATILEYRTTPWTTTGGRNPLTGLCGLQLGEKVAREVFERMCRNPLTGLCGLQHVRRELMHDAALHVAIPLRGYVVCNGYRSPPGGGCAYRRVAIPLRGYVVCNLTGLIGGTTWQRRVAIPLRG